MGWRKAYLPRDGMKGKKETERADGITRARHYDTPLTRTANQVMKQQVRKLRPGPETSQNRTWEWDGRSRFPLWARSTVGNCLDEAMKL